MFPVAEACQLATYRARLNKRSIESRHEGDAASLDAWTKCLPRRTEGHLVIPRRADGADFG